MSAAGVCGEIPMRRERLQLEMLQGVGCGHRRADVPEILHDRAENGTEEDCLAHQVQKAEKSVHRGNGKERFLPVPSERRPLQDPEDLGRGLAFEHLHHVSAQAVYGGGTHDDGTDADLSGRGETGVASKGADDV